MAVPTDPHPDFVPGQPARANEVDDRFAALYNALNPATGGVDIGALKTAVDALAGAGQAVPAATIFAFGGAAAPPGYLWCDGAPYLRTGSAPTGFPALFAALGGAASAYGLPDGSHFNVPDLRGRVPVGVDGAAARLSGSDALGNAAGTERVALALGELPVDSHANPGGGIYLISTDPGGGSNVEVNVSDLSSGHMTMWYASNTGTNGNGDSHANLQPYQIVSYVIKT
jgi:microcystin-dependent protein